MTVSVLLHFLTVQWAGVGWSDTQLSFNSELIPTLKFMLMVKEEMSFKDIIFLSSGSPLFS